MPTASGDAVCNIVSRPRKAGKDKNSGEAQKITEWHRVVFYRKLAEIAGQYLKKGSPVYIEGRIKTHKWQDKDGQDRYTTEIEATEMQMLGGRQGMGAPASAGGGGGYDNAPQVGYSPAPPKNRPKPSFDDLGDDIPF